MSRDFQRESSPSPTAWQCADCRGTFEVLTVRGHCPQCDSDAVAPYAGPMSICPRCGEPILAGEPVAVVFHGPDQHIQC